MLNLFYTINNILFYTADGHVRLCRLIIQSDQFMRLILVFLFMYNFMKT